MADSTSEVAKLRWPRDAGRDSVWRDLGATVVLAACYFAAAKLALALAIAPGYATAVWPPSGIALAALLLFGRRLWPGIWAGAALVNYSVEGGWLLAASIATGNTLEAVVGVWLVRHFVGAHAAFEGPESAFRFVGAVAVGALVAALIGVATLYLGGRVDAAALVANAYTWWQGDAAGMIVVTPFLLAWLRPMRDAAELRRRRGEAVVFAATLLVALAVIFGYLAKAAPHLPIALEFLLIPFIVWAGCRYSERVVTATILVIAAVALGATFVDPQPHPFRSVNEALLVLQAFICTVALIGLVLCAYTQRRSEVAEQLRKASDFLEATVSERTLQLEQTNRQLARDLDERVRLAAALQRREAQLAEAQALTHIGSWNLDVATGQITWSDELYRMFGVAPGEFAGTLEAHLAFVHPADRAQTAAVVCRARDTCAPWEAVERCIRADGAVRVVKSVGDVWTDSAGAVVSVYGACIDVTEATRRQRMQDVQQQITEELVKAPSWPDAIVRSLQIVCEKLDWVLGQMWAVDADGRTLRLRYAWSRADERYAPFIEASRRLACEPGFGLPGRVWQGVAPQWIEDVPSDPTRPRGRYAVQCGIRGALCFPLVAGQRVLGALEFFSEERRRPEDELLQALVALGSQLGEYIVRNRAETLLRESEERFRLLIEGVKDYAIIMLDPNGYVTTWNAGAARINGYASEEILGQHFSRFYTADDRAHGKPERLLAEARERGAVEDESWRVRKDGSLFWANVALTVLHAPNGELRGFAKVTRDMTERKQMEALEEAGRQTQQFLAMLGHELRNPLAPIRNAVGVMRMREIADPQVAYCRDLIERQVGQLVRLVDDLLDASRITTGTIGLHPEPLALAEVVARAVEASRPGIDERGHALVLDIASDPIVVVGDRTRLVQVIQNLLNNAAKFTPRAGRIVLALRRERHQGVIEVRDSGIGIAPELLPKVFDLFVQADGGLARTEGGLGVGLALALRIVEMHGGSIEGKSEGNGRGATFVVRLPLLADQTATEPPRAHPGAIAPGHPRSVLVVDDNRDAADSVAELLRLRGHRVMVAYDGPTALTTAAEHAPDVVLLDIGLPGMDGYEVGVRLREGAATRTALILALTGYGQTEDRRRSEAARFDGHLVKPVDIETLYARVERTA